MLTEDLPDKLIKSKVSSAAKIYNLTHKTANHGT